MGRKAVNLQGKRFGSLVVIERIGIKGSHAGWLCRCEECGNTCVVRGDNLLSGRTKTCRCKGYFISWNAMGKQNMFTASNSVSRLDRKGGNPYHNLANAIIAMAADDYRMALNGNNKRLSRSLEAFFLSDWFLILSYADGQLLMKNLKREQWERKKQLFCS